MNHLNVPSDEAVLQPGLPQFSPAAHSLRFVYSTTFSDTSAFLGRSVEERKRYEKQVTDFCGIIIRTERL